MKRAFTLIELLVVISIISMLASVILVNTASVKASGRDGLRTQQIHQIDLAVKLYIETNGKAPLTLCDIQSQAPTPAEASACFAVSSAGGVVWDRFVMDITPYMLHTPGDPCLSGCTSPSGFPLGYAYGAPRAMQYYCSTLGNNCSANSRSYELYTPLERSPNLIGTREVGDFFNPTVAAPSILSFIPRIVLDSANPPHRYFTWSVNNASTCSLSDTAGVLSPSINPFVMTGNPANGNNLSSWAIFPSGDIVTLTCSSVGGSTMRQLTMP
ncbi:MAG: hypothetical protein RLY66_691 [Candidatus Parcubacteria bacterium]|jgi:prepilin-type N-terminal cleavage/methylation domain-containing protein